MKPQPTKEDLLKSNPHVDAAVQQEALAAALAYAFARTDLPAKTETGRDYADRLVPLMVESGYLAAIVPEDAVVDEALLANALLEFDPRESFPHNAGIIAARYREYARPVSQPFDGCYDRRLGNGCTCPCHRPVSRSAERERLGRQALSEAMQDTYVSRDPEMARLQLDQMWRALTERGYTVARLSGDDEGLAAALDGIRDEVRDAVLEGDTQDCSSADCIADAVYEIVRVRLAAMNGEPSGLPEALSDIWLNAGDESHVRAVVDRIEATLSERSDA